MSILGNTYVRIAVSSAVAVYIVPAINNAFVVPVFSPGQNTPDAHPGELRQDLQLAGIFGAVTSAVYVVLSMLLGAPTTPPPIPGGT